MIINRNFKFIYRLELNTNTNKRVFKSMIYYNKCFYVTILFILMIRMYLWICKQKINKMKYRSDEITVKAAQK